MRDRYWGSTWWPVAASLVAVLLVALPAWGQQRSSTPSTSSKDAEPVVRTFGSEGGYRTEVTSRTKGTLSDEDRRQISVLMAHVFQHIQAARDGVDAEDADKASKEVQKGLEAIKAIRAMLPKTIVHTRTTTPDGKVAYEDDREIQESRLQLFEGMVHEQTIAPILAARRNALEVAGAKVVESELIATEAFADLDAIEAQLKRAANALKEKKLDVAANALALALVRGVDFKFIKEDTPLASARDALWLARRSLEENNIVQAAVNLAAARQRLLVFRDVLSQDKRQEVEQMLREVEQLEAQLRQEGTPSATRAERARQGSQVTHWWDRVNSWFRRHL